MATKSRIPRKRVKFGLHADSSSTVFLAGSFNDWAPDKRQLKHTENGHSATLLLPRGRYEYKFIVDGQWRIDPECLNRAPNLAGTWNSVINVS